MARSAVLKIAAISLGAGLALGACSSSDDVGGSGSASASASSGTGSAGASSGAAGDVPSECTDPLASAEAGDEVRQIELVYCEAEAMADLEGYVISQYDGEELVSTGRVNIDPLGVEIIPGSAGAEVAGGGGSSGEPIEGQIILTGGTTYYFEDGAWHEASLDSEDPDVAYKATLPTRFEILSNPERRAKLANTDAVATVVGEEKIEGHPVTVLETEGESGETRQYMTDDYLVIRTETTIGERAGYSEMTHIDENQEIRRPQVDG